MKPTQTDLAALTSEIATLRAVCDAIHAALAEGSTDPRGKNFVVEDAFGTLTFKTVKRRGRAYAVANGRAPAHQASRWTLADAQALAQAVGGTAEPWMDRARRQLAGLENLILTLEGRGLAA